MNVQEFVRKWTLNNRSEKSASQEQFIDLCRLFEHPTPNDDASGDDFAFEKGAERIGGKSGQGWADVWKRNHFAWEYKGAHANLEAALKQLLQYRGNLDNPPLLVVSDMKKFIIHTNWTNTPDKRIEISLEDLKEAHKFAQLRDVFHDPDRLKPDRRIDDITQDVAARFAEIALSMSGTRENPGRFEPLRVARFLDRVVFTLFAEDVDLLPDQCFSKICEGDKTRYNPARFAAQLRQLWDAMENGGDFGPYPIRHFNGGLFREVEVLEPTQTELDKLRDAARTDWSNVDASIFGTLFERALDPDKRSQLGAHYTSRGDIEDLLEPVLLRPLREEWNGLRDRLTPLLDDPTPRETIAQQVNDFGQKLAALRVLDPACGSGNFLYIALQSLKDIEQSVRVWMRDAGLREDFPSITPANFCGLELNVYAHDLAATTLQIGWLQWLKRNGAPTPPEPILQAPVDIQNRDALLEIPDPTNLSTAHERTWPTCDVIVGNPPFLGGKLLRREMGNDYVEALFRVYRGRVPAEADLCCYWFEKARACIQMADASRAGLLATQGIRGGANREVLKRIKESGDIFWAVSDRKWMLDGAAVHVSIIGFDAGQGARTSHFLDGQSVPRINSNLSGGIDLTEVSPLLENRGLAFMGDTKGGAFDVSFQDAQIWLHSPNPHGNPTSDVLLPWINGQDVTGRSREMFIVDFGMLSQSEAELYEMPYGHIESFVQPVRANNNRELYRRFWWRHVESRPGMIAALRPLPRFITTPTTAKHRLFTWVEPPIIPDHALIAFARDDDYFFGVLHSRVHEVWALRQGTQLEDRPRYTPETCFLTFPFPHPTPEQEAAIAAAAQRLHERREAWLNPSEWLREEEITFRAGVSGPWARLVRDPDERGIGTATYRRRVMRDPRQTVTASRFDAATKTWRPTTEWLESALPRRTLTMLYNERPAWLASAHAALDAAVCAAYGLPADASDETILSHLLALNAERAATN